jgi:hypothetical protein
VDGSTTLVEAGKLSIVNAAARSREHFPFGVSGSDCKTAIKELAMDRQDALNDKLKVCGRAERKRSGAPTFLNGRSV